MVNVAMQVMQDWLRFGGVHRKPQALVDVRVVCEWSLRRRRAT
jgi:hypothetical protein